MNKKKKYDFSGYATKVGLKCADGRTIMQNAFEDMDGAKVPLVYQHLHNDPKNVLGHAVLENRADGVYSYCYLNNTESGKVAKDLVKHGDIDSLSIYANSLVQKGTNVVHGVIREVSLVISGANPGAYIDNLAFEHADGSVVQDDEEAIISIGALVHDAIEIPDEEEIDPLGQHLRDTFYLADVFVEAGLGGNADGKLEEQLRRYFKLLFGEEIVTPTPDECGMHLAYSASLRSSDLSRQVGAAVLNPENEVISLGTNEVPSPEGGQYWGDVESDYRDFKKGYDSNARMKIDVLKEILEVVDEHYKGLSSAEKGSYIDSMVERLGQTRLMNLTEFGRSVHAEMEAIICAGRNGVPVRGSTLYTTTFPCHNCAKHIINAGIKRVVYIEPYPKSLAKELHDDAMTVCESDSDDIKVRFEPFVGIGPRIYRTMFSILQFDGSRVKRKEKSGNISTSPHGLRNTLVHCTYLDLESAAAIQAKDMAPNESERKDENGSNNSSA